VAPEEIPAFLGRVYGFLGTRIIELLRVARKVSRGTLLEGCELRHGERFDQALAGGKGLILGIGHTGNYELAGLTVSARGYPVNSLARPVTNPYIDRWGTRVRTVTGSKISPSDRAAREMLAVLRRNEILVIELDIDAKDAGQLVDFCGRPVSMHDGAARLALKRGAPIIVVEIYREGATDVVDVQEPIDASRFAGRPDDVEELTKEIARRFDEAVRRRPDQWLWLLDRWRGADRRLECQTPQAGSIE